MIFDKNLAFKRFVNKKSVVNTSSNLERFSSPQNKLSSLIETSKQEYFPKIAKKLSDPSISSKIYWSILKIFLTGKNVPCIPPIFHENKFITDFSEKAELFNSFFANQCSLIKNTSVLPTNCESPTDKSYLTLPLLTMTLGKQLKA